MLDVKVKYNINFPKIVLADDLLRVANDIIITDITRGILAQRSITGGSLPRNEDKTLERKRKLKQSGKSLLATRTLIKSFFAEKVDESKVKIKIREGRDDIAYYLQEVGIGKKKKKYEFFGISKNASDRVLKYMRKRIKEIISG